MNSTLKNISSSNKATKKKLDYTLKRKSFNSSKTPLEVRLKSHNVLNESIMSSVSKGTMDLDLQTIRELIELMVKHEKKCNDEGNFVQAGLIKDRAEQLRKIEEIKVFDQVQNQHEQQKESLSSEQDDALKVFNSYYDNQTEILHNDYNIKEKELTEKHKLEIIRCKGETAHFFPEHPKPSANIIKKHDALKNLQKLRK
jgi:hypothetical protein